MMSIKPTKKKIREVSKTFLTDKDLTKFCRTMKQMGITNKWVILCKCEEVLGKRDSSQMWSQFYFSVKTDDLEKSPETFFRTDDNLLQELIRNRNSGAYKKILFVGNKHIYWCSPIYGHKDYNKSVWRENTPQNRAKAEIINRFLNK